MMESIGRGAVAAFHRDVESPPGVTAASPACAGLSMAMRPGSHGSALALLIQDRCGAPGRATRARHWRSSANGFSKSRRERGFVRHCHGDLHLRNIVVQREQIPSLFDGVEFNDEMACVDVLYGLAFLLMDLWRRRLAGTCQHCLESLSHGVGRISKALV